MLKNQILFVALLVLSVGAFAQEMFKVSGKVTEENGEPIPGASLYFKEANKQANSDFNGNYEIMLEKGQYTVVWSCCYTPIVKKITVEGNLVLNFSLVDKVEQLDEAIVKAVRVKADAPVTHSNLTKKQITKRNLGQDIPVLMNFLPSVVTTSDAGAGVGYTGIRVRGSDATRVNVTINGIPYNDSESQGTFWVNMPDFASSTQNIQLQRGVGSSTNGAGAFGASLNLLTDGAEENAFAEISNTFGSFNTKKHTLKVGTGKLNDSFEVTARLSKITSDGYIDRASSNLKSYFLQGTYHKNNTLIKALVFGGHEVTYQSWNGSSQVDIDTHGRTFNSAGALYDSNWNVIRYYDNEVDNYKQDHAQLHWNQKYSDVLSSNIALHYTYGRGFYEQYKQGADFADYNLTPITIGGETISQTDLIRRKWLDNDFYGLTYNVNYKNEVLDVILGGGWNTYKGDHFGEIMWAKYASNSNIRSRYYDNYGNKKDLNLFIKATYKVNDKLSLFADLQNRNVNYEANGVQPNLVDDTFNFFNPKAGVNYKFNNENSVYFSYAKGQREPNRTDYKNGNPKPEKLNDFELGWRLNSNTLKINTNIYYMAYKDQLALTGAINNVGSPIRANIGKSYRLGLEVDAVVRINDYLSISPNFTISQNKNLDFKETNGSVITKLGDTDISYSPNFIAGNIINVQPIENLNIALLSKHVGSQFMSNNEFKDSKLDSYFVNDFNINYTIETKSILKEIVLSGLINNIFNEKYSSNGYMWGTTPYYYPQAGTNFLISAALKF